MNNQEVSFGDVVNKIGGLIKLLLSKWVIILIAGIFGAILGLLYAWNAKPKYIASLNFMLANNSQSGGSLLGLANQFGINLGNGDNNFFSGDNIVVLMKSRRMVQQALFGKPPGYKESLLNTYVKDNKIDRTWQKNTRTKNAYPFPDNAGNMTQVQDSLVRSIYNSIIEKTLDVSKPDKNEDIYVVKTTSTNEIFSYYLVKYLVDSTSAFYINTRTKISKQNLDMLQREADSVRQVLGSAITSSGSQTDRTFNLNPAYQVQRSGALQSQASASALGQAYGQILQNLEVAKITLQKETPLYQIIDEPSLPLEQQKPSKFFSLVAGGFLAALIVCCIIILKNLYKDYFNKSNQ